MTLKQPISIICIKCSCNLHVTAATILWLDPTFIQMESRHMTSVRNISSQDGRQQQEHNGGIVLLILTFTHIKVLTERGSLHVDE